MKVIILVLLTSIFLDASYLIDKNYPLCAEDYYWKSGQIHYLRSSNNTWYSTSEDHTARFVYSGYKYENGNCVPIGLNSLGLTPEQYNFLMALSGLIFSSIIFFIISTFLVGL